MWRKIEVSVDTFALIWAARLSNETSEDQIIARLARNAPDGAAIPAAPPVSPPPPPLLASDAKEMPITSAVTLGVKLPHSSKWTDLLVWTLETLGGKATLADIYRKSKEGRRALGMRVTPNHDASARECLESFSSDSDKWRERGDLFCMPEGKGAGVWALRKRQSP